MKSNLTRKDNQEEILAFAGEITPHVHAIEEIIDNYSDGVPINAIYRGVRHKITITPLGNKSILE